MSNTQSAETQEYKLELSEEQKENLYKIGYTDAGIEGFINSAKTESDYAFLNSLAEGDYKSAFSISHELLSDDCLIQLSVYEVNLATVASTAVCSQETEKQVDVLLAHYTYENNPYEVVQGNTHGEYASVIKELLCMQAEGYGAGLTYKEQYDNDITKNDVAYGTKLNNYIILWDSFVSIQNYEVFGEEKFADEYKNLLDRGMAMVQIDDIAKDENGMYTYQLKMLDSVTKEPIIEGMQVSFSQRENVGAIREKIADASIDAQEEKEYLSEHKESFIARETVNNFMDSLSCGVTGCMDKYEQGKLDGYSIAGSGVNIMGNVLEGISENLMEEYPTLARGLTKEIVEKCPFVAGVVGDLLESRADAEESYNDEIAKLDSQLAFTGSLLSTAYNGHYTTMTVRGAYSDGSPLALTTEVGEDVVMADVWCSMAYLQSGGITEYLKDVGVENIWEVKQELLQSLDAEKLAYEWYDDASVTPEKILEISQTITSMVNGGNLSNVDSAVFLKLQNEINSKLNDMWINDGVPNGFIEWMAKEHDYMADEVIFPTEELIFLSPKPLCFGGHSVVTTQNTNLSAQAMER